MDAKKIYRVLSIVFLVLAVLFFVLYRNEQKIKSEISDEFIQSAVENLNESGVNISEEIIEKTIPERDIFYFEIDSLEVHYEVITKALCQSVYASDVSTAKFETPDGISVGIYGKDSQTEIGRIIFNGSDFSFRLYKNGVNISGTDVPVKNGNLEIVSEPNRKLVENICDSLTSGAKVSYRLSGCSGDSDLFVVTSVQMIDGHDCSDIFMNFVFENNELVSVSGKWVAETPKAKYNNTLTDGINVLYSLDIDSVSEVLNQRIVYVLKNADKETYYFVPVWEITYLTKDGVNKVELFDAI